MRKAVYLLLGICIPLIMAAGLPSRPRFQSVTVSTGAGFQSSTFSAADGLDGSNSRVVVAAGGANVALFMVPATNTTPIVTGGPVGGQAVIRTLGTQPLVFGVNNTFAGQINAGEIVPAQSSGNFTASFDAACATTPTITFGYVKSGDVVTLRIKSLSGFPCTSDAAQFFTTGTPVPAALRPPAGVTVATALYPTCLDNGADTACAVLILPGGDVQISRYVGATLTAWTGSGNKRGPSAGTALMSYSTTDP
jgi:hypothetical protein